ncbi:MAG: HAD hydrolase-like protein [Oscillospiraceae bacterium]|nr:HAD hydrolase-like protein [Oscillospiraceae bacterium]
MIDTILFDLDGTLIRYRQDDFIKTYFNELSKVFVKLDLDAKTAVNGIWVGTKAMIKNDGAELNTKRFWDAFSEYMNLEGDQLKLVEDSCDRFYSNEFNVAKSLVQHSDISARTVREMAKKGYNLVLATNPVFPPCAVDSRLAWIGLTQQDFQFVTHYENSSFCKPNPNYYKEVLTKIDKSPEQCLMVGNNPAEDMCVKELGMSVFLVTDYIENEAELDINEFTHGTMEDMEEFLMAMPSIPF